MPEKLEMFMARKNKNMTEAMMEEISVLPKSEKSKGWKKIKGLLSGKKTPRILLGIIFLLLIGISIYYYHQYQKLKADPNAVAQEEINRAVAEVGKIMKLPPNETPTLATVSDAGKLQGQEFFQNAQNGDKILIYTNAKEAILYRPSANMIINVAPLVMDQNGNNQTAQNNNQLASPNSPASNQTVQAATAPVSSNNTSLVSPTTPDNSQPTDNLQAANSNDNTQNPLNVVIDNGSKTVGLAQTTQNKLTGISGVNVISTGDAKKNNYTGTIVVDLTQKNPTLLSQIAQAVSGQVGTLPAGETKPNNADVLIIAGE
jgi:hypothetical protein